MSITWRGPTPRPEMDEPCIDDAELEDKTDWAEPEDDDFTPKDAFLAGSFADWAYEEGLRKRKRRKRKTSEDDDDLE